MYKAALGVDGIKALLAFPLAVHMAYDKAKSDGTIDITDAAFLVDPLMKAIPAFQLVQQALDELKDLDETERGDVLAWAKAEYDIADDELELKVEKALGVALSIAEFVGALKA